MTTHILSQLPLAAFVELRRLVRYILFADLRLATKTAAETKASKHRRETLKRVRQLAFEQRAPDLGRAEAEAEGGVEVDIA